MKKFIFLILGLFIVLGAGKAQMLDYYDQNDLKKLMDFMQQHAADENGNPLPYVFNAELILKNNDLDSWKRGQFDWLYNLDNGYEPEYNCVKWDRPEGEKIKRLIGLNFYRPEKPDYPIYLSGPLNFNDCAYLQYVKCDDERLTTANFANCPKLEQVNLSYNIITSANFEKSENIWYLNIYINKLLPSKIKLTQLPKVFSFFDQRVTGSDNTLVKKDNELYVRVDLSAELNIELLQPYKPYITWDKGVLPVNSTDKSGIFDYKLIDLQSIQNRKSSLAAVNIIYESDFNYSDFESGGSLKYLPNIISSKSAIHISTDPPPQGATAHIYWVKDGKFIFVETLEDITPDGKFTNLLPAGDYVIHANAPGYLFSYYSDPKDTPVSSWKDERIKKVSPGESISFALKEKNLKKGKIEISGNVVEEDKKQSPLKASVRVLHKSTVKLHSTISPTPEIAPEDEWILEATTQTNEEDGSYSFTDLPQKTYRITVEIPGYEMIESIILQPNSEGAIFGNQNFLVSEENETITPIAEKQIILDDVSNEEMQLTLYPNPVTDVVRIDGLKGVCTVKIINMSGQVVKSMKATSTELMLQFNDLPSGMYLIRIESEGNVQTLKLIKNY